MTPFERDSRFDDLARIVSEGIPRRTALRRIGAFVAALALSGPAEALGATRKKKCPKGHALCGSHCCPTGYTCHTHRGRKACACTSPKKVCSGTCINPKTDPRHCGSCGKKCKSSETCGNGRCVAHKTSPAAPTCSDGIRNGNETDVDCGGPTCPKCATGKTCASGTDCVSGVCTNGVCVTAPKVCSATVCGAQNGCPACANGQGCGTGADCSSGHCSGGVCVQCAAATDCPPAAAGSCQAAVCTAGVCAFTADNANLPANTACTTGTCTGGTPGHQNVADHTVCGAGLVCSGGQCVGCADATDCPAPASGSCQTATCTAGVCGVGPDNANTPASTACATGTCTNGTPGHQNVADHTVCGASLVCSGGQCVGCFDDTDCPAAAAGSCQKASCGGGVCGFVADPTKDNTACGPVANETVCCTGACIQLGTVQHCMACHNACAPNQHCCGPDVQGCTAQPCL
jgi:hypothetical protein